MNSSIINNIQEASKVIGKTWPLYTFVASNPLSGYENSSFKEAVGLANKHLNANSYPAAKLYRQAWERGDINKVLLEKILIENKLTDSPEAYLKQLELEKNFNVLNSNHELDVVISKWLAAFMDEGLAEWDIPFKSEGFYTAWRYLAIYDTELGNIDLKDIPKTSMAALVGVLKDYSEKDQVKIFTHHLAALPGWTGYINHRVDSNSEWQEDYPISLLDYLAARLWTAKKLNCTILPESVLNQKNEFISNLQYIWLKAWEQSWQSELITTLENISMGNQTLNETKNPDAQMVFCIDTRSELIRRHVEINGDYETYGYAGFFGIAMDYKSQKDGITRKSCPPIVSSAYRVVEKAQVNNEKHLKVYNKKNELLNFSNYFLKRMKNMLPSAFGYVEGSGFYYGLSLATRTLFPGKIYKLKDRNNSKMENVCTPNLEKQNTEEISIPLEEKVAIVKSAFDLMGWKKFAPLVIFVGHGSHSANNPFSSSLDCGACAASPGRHNARMLAKLANLPEVRLALNKVHGIIIPEDSIFLGAEHNTTTDAILLFDSEIPDLFKNSISVLKVNLAKAQKTATLERLGGKNKSVALAQKRANNWGETRPEWGLAKNAGLIVGPRKLTKNTNLDSRCFLHSYEWEADTEGKALEGIMQGPMVVTQWINNHYYFSTVDNDLYGGGSKITHNITGKYGVVQGNGGDLKMGLPLQSLYGTDEEMHHQPLRLSVIIQAPSCRVIDILERNQNLKTLLDNEWMYLMVMDPTNENKIIPYAKLKQLEPVPEMAP